MKQIKIKMDITKDREQLKNYRKYITELEQELNNINLLLQYSTEKTYPDLIIRKNYIIRQINKFETKIGILKDDLSTLSRS